MRKPIIAGNWKLNKTIAESADFVTKLKPLVAGIDNVDIVVCPPFTALADTSEATRGSNIKVGAQGVFWKESGAYTGEVAPGMLRDAGCTHVIIGHSERRGRFGKPEFSDELAAVFGDNDATVNAKVQAALTAGLIPIVCCGELLSERKASQTDAVVAAQIRASLADLTSDRVAGLVLAYEPVWAIGTGDPKDSSRVCEADEANRVCGLIRNTVAELLGEQATEAVRIQYGGSVTPKNIAGLIAQPHIDGALVGGASLQPESFAEIVKAAGK